MKQKMFYKCRWLILGLVLFACSTTRKKTTVHVKSYKKMIVVENENINIPTPPSNLLILNDSECIFLDNNKILKYNFNNGKPIKSVLLNSIYNKLKGRFITKTYRNENFINYDSLDSETKSMFPPVRVKQLFFDGNEIWAGLIALYPIKTNNNINLKDFFFFIGLNKKNFNVIDTLFCPVVNVNKKMGIYPTLQDPFCIHDNLFYLNCLTYDKNRRNYTNYGVFSIGNNKILKFNKIDSLPEPSYRKTKTFKNFGIIYQFTQNKDGVYASNEEDLYQLNKSPKLKFTTKRIFNDNKFVAINELKYNNLVKNSFFILFWTCPNANCFESMMGPGETSVYIANIENNSSPNWSCIVKDTSGVIQSFDYTKNDVVTLSKEDTSYFFKIYKLTLK